MISWWVILGLLGACTGQNRPEVRLVQDFLENLEEPRAVTAFLCWGKGDLIRLQVAISSSGSLGLVYRRDFHRFTPSNLEKNLFILDLTCPGTEEVLQKGNSKRLFAIHTKWLIFSGTTAEDLPRSVFRNVDALVDSSVILVTGNGAGPGAFALNYAYKVSNDSDVVLQHFGDWEESKGFLSYKNQLVMWRRRNLMKGPLKAALIYTEDDSLNHVDDYRFGNIDTQMKLNFQLVTHLSDLMNASLELSWERAWGEYIGNNTYTGMLGRIHRKEIDLGASPLFCVKERLSFYDCVAMTTPARGFFLFRQPPLSYVANIFTLPFETNLWLTDIAFLAISSLFLYLASVIEWKVLREKEEQPHSDMLSDNIWDSFMFTIGAVCQQGYPDEPKSASGRIVTLTLCFTLIFMFTAFSANTVVLFQSSASNIRTLEDLYNSKMPLGVHDMLYYRFWFAKTFEPVRRKIYLDRITPKGEKPRFFEIRKGFEMMRTQYFAFHTDAVVGYKVISDTFEEHEKCGLQRIGYLLVKDPWVTAPKHSSFRELYYIGYKLMHERGLVMREVKKLYTQAPECTSKGSNFRSAGILDLYSVYMLFFMGLAASLGLLILEIIGKKLIEPRIIKYMVAKMARKAGNQVALQRF